METTSRNIIENTNVLLFFFSAMDLIMGRKMQQTFTEVSEQTHYHIPITLPETKTSLPNTIYLKDFVTWNEVSEQIKI